MPINYDNKNQYLITNMVSILCENVAQRYFAPSYSS